MPHNIVPNHPHVHGPSCGHVGIKHAGHVDYLHEGHLHSAHDGHVDEHELDANAKNPDRCTRGHQCSGHEAAHAHGPACGHEAIPHAGHVDYLVGDHLHHVHDGHCDDHGPVDRA